MSSESDWACLWIPHFFLNLSLCNKALFETYIDLQPPHFFDSAPPQNPFHPAQSSPPRWPSLGVLEAALRNASDKLKAIVDLAVDIKSVLDTTSSEVYMELLKP